MRALAPEETLLFLSIPSMRQVTSSRDAQKTRSRKPVRRTELTRFFCSAALQDGIFTVKPCSRSCRRRGARQTSAEPRSICFSKYEFPGELELSRILSAGYLPEVRGPVDPPREIKVRVVERIERIDSELHGHALANAPLLLQRHVQSLKARAYHHVPPRRAEGGSGQNPIAFLGQALVG